MLVLLNIGMHSSNMKQRKPKLVKRSRLLGKILEYLDEAPITVLLGARQTGKTTLAKMVADEVRKYSAEAVHFFDLERPASQMALSTPEITLEPLNGLVIIDEIQRIPQLFEILRPLADRDHTATRFLVLGSASPDLVRGVSESLAGRALFLQVPGFSLDELAVDLPQNSLWVRGGFPRSLLATSDNASCRWRNTFITTFLERDIPQLGIRIPAETLRRFWTMTAHYHGQIWNASELARSLGVSHKTALYYRDILGGSYVLRVLPPWFENLKKRQVRAHKTYVRDSGLLHSLLGITDMDALRSHPRYGASWEGFALEQIVSLTGSDNAYFWSTQRGAELDLLLVRDGKRFGFEFKCSDAPGMTKSMHIALNDLSLDSLCVIYPGSQNYRLHEKVEVVSLIEWIKNYDHSDFME